MSLADLYPMDDGRLLSVEIHELTISGHCSWASEVDIESP